MKKCIYCQNEIPDEAHFCMHCARSQEEKHSISQPRLYKKKLTIICAIVAVLIAAAAVILFATRARTIDNGGAEVIYKYNGQTWHVLLKSSVSDLYHWKTPDGSYERTVNSDIQAAIPLQLYIYDEETGESAAKEFMAALDHNEITAVPEEGYSAPQCNNPVYDQGFPYAALVADIVYDASCAKNDIAWSLSMKDGSTLVLHEKMELTVRPDVEYSWENTPLGTSEELQALLDQIDMEGIDASVKIYLPAVTYEGDVNINDTTVTLIGNNNGAGTVFHGTIHIDSENSQPADIRGILFEGENSGIIATKSFFAEGCTFSGAETGIEAIEESWPMVYQCTFENCGTGIHTNSPETVRKNVYFGELVFTDNQTGVFLEQLEGEDVLYFDACTFEGNGTDIDNRTAHAIAYELEGN